MDLGENYRVTVYITKSLDTLTLLRNIIEKENLHSDVINLSSKVRVSLIDPRGDKGFEINPISTEEQLIDDSSSTKWQWNVRPKRAGKNGLLLKATVILHSTPKDVAIFEKNIKVKASIFAVIKQFIIENWQIILSLCIIPFIVWLSGRIFDRIFKEKDGIDSTDNGVY